MRAMSNGIFPANKLYPFGDRIPDQDALAGHPVVGPSWEGFVIENLLSMAPALNQRQL
jgi:hypothetical protein